MLILGKSPLKHSVPLLRVHSKTVPSSGSSSALRALSAASLKQQNRTAKVYILVFKIGLKSFS